MKKIDNVVHGLKTAGLVAGLSLTLNSCSDTKKTDLSQQDLRVVSRRTDSVLQNNPMYKLSCDMNEYAGKYLENYKSANKDLVKTLAIKYINRHIKDIALRNIMANILQQEYYTTDDDIDVIYENLGVGRDVKSFIRNNYRWFNDALLYLSGKYTDAQFLKTDFFRVVNNERAYNTFKQNAAYIQKFYEIEKCSNKEMVALHDRAWNQCTREQKNKKQR